jgi:N-acyl-D-amino-acid deacylase
VLLALQQGGASNTAMIRDAAQRGLALLQKSGPQFSKISNCASCHHQFLPQMAAGLARSRGIAVDEEVTHAQTEAIAGMFRPLREVLTSSKDRIPDPSITVSYALLALGAQDYPKDETTEAMAGLIGSVQLQDGSFRAFGIRPPIESSDFAATALTIRALGLYGKGGARQIAQARAWLRDATAKTLEDHAMQVLGLAWSYASADDLRKPVERLRALQQPDGGWAQLPTLGSDAYATGQALVALSHAGVPASDTVYRQGIAYLLRTQFADGSWLVRTRTFPFQQYKESGFPHGKDQWISAAATGWAVMALSLALPETRVVSVDVRNSSSGGIQ